MDKKTMLRVFGEAFLRSMVVLMAIAIIGFGVFFLIKVNSDDKENMEQQSTQQASTYSDEELQAMIEEENADDTEATTEDTEEVTEEVTTEEVTTEVQTIPSTDKNILILNSTSVAGLASSWKSKIDGAGFANTAIGNYNTGSETQTKIYVAEEGMGEDLLEYFNDATLVVGALGTGDYTIKGGAAMDTIDIFIVIGNNDTSVQ